MNSEMFSTDDASGLILIECIINMGGHVDKDIAHLKEANIGKDDMTSLNEKCSHIQDISMQRRTEGK